MKSLFSLSNPGTENIKPLKSQRKQKSNKAFDAVIKPQGKVKAPKDLQQNSKVVEKPVQPNTELDSAKWFRTPNKLPDELRPIEFNTTHKKPVRGYRLRNGYITDTPYYVDMFKKRNGYIEWRYINYCTSLTKCPKEFPSCNGCKNNRGIK